MDYSAILAESFQIFWKHKRLWLFGMIMAVMGQSDYRFSVNYRESYSYSGNSDLPPDMPDFFDNPLLVNFFENPLPYIVIFLIISLGWWTLSTLIGWWAQGALINMVDEIDRTGTAAMRRSWEVGAQRVPTLFGLAFLLALPRLLFIVLFLAVIFSALSPIWEPLSALFRGNPIAPDSLESQVDKILPIFFQALGCFVLLICCGAIIGWAFDLLHKLAARSCVLENLGVIDSIKRGWQVTTRNLGYTLLNWFILVVVAGFFAFGAAIPALVLWVPTAQAFLNSDWTSLSVGTALTLSCYLLIAALGVGGTLNSFNAVLWTKLYKGFLAADAPVDLDQPLLAESDSV